MADKYKVVWDNGAEACGGIGLDNLEDAKNSALDILWGFIESWYADSEVGIDGEYSQEEIDSWNDMINSADAYVVEYDEDKKDYVDCWYPSDDDLIEIGWVEIRL